MAEFAMDDATHPLAGPPQIAVLEKRREDFLLDGGPLFDPTWALQVADTGTVPGVFRDPDEAMPLNILFPNEAAVVAHEYDIDFGIPSQDSLEDLVGGDGDDMLLYQTE